MNQPRKNKGAPDGGQWRALEHSEPEVTIGPDVKEESNDAEFMHTRVRKVNESKLADLLSQLEVNTVKAEKMGIEPPRVNIIRSYDVTERDEVFGFDKTYKVYEVEIYDPPMKWDGWEFVAVVDHETGVVKTSPGAPEGIIREFHNSLPTCDLCGKVRNRNKTIVVRDDHGEIKRVGGECVKKYLGGDKSLNSSLIDWYSSDHFDLDSNSHFNYQKHTETTDYLTASAAAIRNFGFTPRNSNYPTANLAFNILYRHTVSSHDKFLHQMLDGLSVTKGDREMAIESIEWAQSLTDDNEFNINLKAVANSKTINGHAGLAAFIVEGYRRHLESAKNIEEKPPFNPDLIPSVPSGRSQISGTVKKIRCIETDFGDAWKMRVEHPDGWSVWGSVPRSIVDDVVIGSKVSFSGNVTQSEDKHYFGFFSRPTKAQIIEQPENYSNSNDSEEEWSGSQFDDNSEEEQYL